MDIYGKEIAASIQAEIKKEIQDKGLTPTLAFFLMEDHAPSKLYVGMKVRACKEVGITSIKETLPADITEDQLLQKIKSASNDPKIDAILVQMPLPDSINSNKIILAIDPLKDVDGFHPINIGKMLLGEKDALLPCTPLGICTMLDKAGVVTEGKNIAIIGRSMIVGKPLANMLSAKGKDGTVTLLHSKSPNLAEHVKQADIIIAAIGKPLFVKKEMVKENAVCIDVGINHVDGILTGDIDYKNVKDVASKISPVPGGVGPMTIAMLLKNTVKCHKIQNQ